MKKLITVAISFAFIYGAAYAAPNKPDKPKTEEAGHRMERAIIVPFSGDFTATLWLPDTSSQTIEITGNQIKLPKTGVDNYHVLVAEQQQENTLAAYIRYVYRHGKPSGHSTSEVVAAAKTALEIIPDPIPREHNRYHSAQDWSFIVRFNNERLTNQKVTLKTSHGSSLTQTTDAKGKVSFVIPDDFANVIDGERDRQQAEFTLDTQYQSAAQNYRTQFSAAYSINPKHWQFTNWGAIAILCGFIGGRMFVNKKHHTGDA